MADTITVLGNVATDPERGATATGIPTLSFRMATNHRRQDSTGAWVDAGTNWFEVKAYRALAENAGVSVTKGDAVVVVGRLKLREWEGKDGKRLSVEIEADCIGPDLRRGRSVYHRMSHQRSEPGEEASGEGVGSALAAVGAGGADSSGVDAWATPGGQEAPY